MKRIQSLKRPPLHAQVTVALRKEIITRGQAGEQLDSEEKLSQQLGVSVLTLRHSLSVLAHEGLIERRHGSGTFIADRKKHQHVAICTATSSNQPMTSFQMRLFFLLGEKFQQAGYQCRFHAVPVGLVAGWSDFARDIEQGRMAGAAFIGMTPEMPSFPIVNSGVPYIGPGVQGVPSVGPDFDAYFRDAFRHLLERGCRRIAVLGWGNPFGVASSHEKLRAIMAELGLPLREEWVRWGISPDTPGAGWEHFREVWTSRKERPDGLLVTDDMLFRDTAMAILECGIKVPQQLQVIAHANKGSGMSYPFPISRLEVDLDEWADAMMKQLIALMNRETLPSNAQGMRARLIPAESGPEARLTANTPVSAGLPSRTLPIEENT